MEKFLSILCTAVLVFYALQYLMRLIGPWLLRKAAKKMFGPMAEQFYDHAQEHKTQEKKKQTDASTTKGDDGVYLKPRQKNGQSVSDMLGGEYVSCEETE